MWWWIKGDGCDITAGLRESMRHDWSGDVDLGDGELPALYAEYMKRRVFIQSIGLEGRDELWDISIDLHSLESELSQDIQFITTGLLWLLL